MDLTDSQIDRYARHLLLREIGGPGQERLLKAKVAVMGAGGLGAPILLYLAAAGIGHLTIIDDDRIDLSNLQRQILFKTAEVGELKVDAAEKALKALNPDVTVERKAVRLDKDNAAGLVAGHDLVIDGSDNFSTRYALHDACYAARIPLVYGAVGRFDGQITVFRGFLPDQPCLHCFMPEAPLDGEVDTCAETGIVGALTGIVGSIEALEAIKLIAGIDDGLAGKLLILDGLTMENRTVRIRKDPECPFCGSR